MLSPSCVARRRRRMNSGGGRVDNRICYIAVVICLLFVGGCREESDGTEQGYGHLSYEDFRAITPRDDEGVYLVEGDILIRTETELREYYEENRSRDSEIGFARSDLIVDRRHLGAGKWADDIWNESDAADLSYCVENGFGNKKETIVNAIASAARAWENVARVHFIYKPEEDADCTGDNGDVRFNVKYVTGKPYLAVAFFPKEANRFFRVLNVDDAAFNSWGYSLNRIITHELGHVLGFRHEYIDRGMGGECGYENADTDWRRVNGYDVNSIMTYLSCNGGKTAGTLSANDKAGATELYGAPSIPNSDFSNDFSLWSYKTSDYVCSSDGAIISCGDNVGRWEHFKFVQNSDGTVSVVAVVNAKYITSGTPLTDKLHAGATSVGTWEKYLLISNLDGSVSLKSMRNNKFVSIPLSTEIPANQLASVANSIGTWEKFGPQVISSAVRIDDEFLGQDSIVAFQAVKNGEFWRDVNSVIRADAGTVGAWEKFQVRGNYGGTVSLWSNVNQKYLGATNPSDWIESTAASVGSWEQFSFENNSDGTVSFKSAKNNKYLTLPTGSNRLKAGASSIDPSINSWEKFRMYVVQSNRLRNPGFEGGRDIWKEGPGVVIEQNSSSSRSGSWNAHLGGDGVTHTDVLSQSVTIPAWATSAMLTFWLWIKTDEFPSMAYDTLRVELRNDAGDVLTTLATYSNLDRSSAYVQKSFDVAAYRGQAVAVYFVGTEDSSLSTSFHVDDSSLLAVAPY